MIEECYEQSSCEESKCLQFDEIRELIDKKMDKYDKKLDYKLSKMFQNQNELRLQNIKLIEEVEDITEKYIQTKEEVDKLNKDIRKN